MPPDIILFLSDDHGAWALGCYGNPEIESPAIDALAIGGARLENAFCTNPVCSPARASLFSGLLPSQHGIHDYLLEASGLESGPTLSGLPLLSEAFQAAGYRTGYFGKWHCGDSWKPAAGFDHWLTNWHDRPGSHHIGQTAWSEDGRRIEIPDGVYTDIIQLRAQSFLRESPPGQPIFLVVAPIATHAPFRDQPESLVERFRRAAFSAIPDETHPDPRVLLVHKPADTAEAEHERRAHYYAAVASIDSLVKDVLSTHAGLGRVRNRIVCYTSDHGHMNGHHGAYTKGNATIPQNFFEESIRVPLVLHAPGRIPAGVVHRDLADHLDLHATLLDLAGLPAPADGRPRPGRSLLPALRGEPAPARPYQFCEYGNARLVRSASAKLILRAAPHAPNFGDEFYDLAADPRETTNRIADPLRAAEIATMREAAEKFWSVYSTPETDGWDILRLPPFNPREPWRFAAPGINP